MCVCACVHIVCVCACVHMVCVCACVHMVCVCVVCVRAYVRACRGDIRGAREGGGEPGGW